MPKYEPPCLTPVKLRVSFDDGQDCDPDSAAQVMKIVARYRRVIQAQPQIAEKELLVANDLMRRLKRPGRLNQYT